MRLIDQTRAGLIDYVCAQIGVFLPDGRAEAVRQPIDRNIDEALARLLKCIDAVKMWASGEFNYLNSAQYCKFIYFLSNTIWRNEQDVNCCTKLFLLNKCLNGIDIFYEISMPDIFLIGHTLGIVLAKASYGNYLVLHQNSTVGRQGRDSPVLGEGVIMYAGTSIIGRCRVGAGTILSAGTYLVNNDAPGNCIVYANRGGKPSFRSAGSLSLSDYFHV